MEVIQTIGTESFLVGLLLFALGFASAFIAFYIWKRLEAANPDAATIAGLAL